ncbi:hypothetical protein [Burkholderia multivorans]|uniref:hypothetical protein n=1 Tax=Burkholderia multivorans TaxID=87883 RepID=UPI0011B1FCE5|nr:hypothetical protein [Burkholderia multivorans]MBU9574065.1 hypothetical protein [Burkholderia multivorans]
MNRKTGRKSLAAYGVRVSRTLFIYGFLYGFVGAPVHQRSRPALLLHPDLTCSCATMPGMSNGDDEVTEDEFQQLKVEIADSADWIEADMPSDHDALLLAEFAKIVLANVSDKELRKALDVLRDWKPTKAQISAEAKRRATRTATKAYAAYVRQFPSDAKHDALVFAYWAYDVQYDKVNGRKKGEPEDSHTEAELVEMVKTWQDANQGGSARSKALYSPNPRKMKRLIETLRQQGVDVSEEDADLFK